MYIPCCRYICRDGILDYMQAICYEISVRTRRPPSWIDPFQYAVDGLVGRNSDPPKVDNHGEKSFCCKVRVTIYYVQYVLIFILCLCIMCVCMYACMYEEDNYMALGS